MKTKFFKIICVFIIVVLSTVALVSCKTKQKTGGGLEVFYDLDLSVDVENSNAYLNEKVTIKNDYDTEINELKLYLYPNACSADTKEGVKTESVTIGNVKSNAQNLLYNIVDTIMTISLDEPLIKGREIQVVITATLNIPENKLRFGRCDGVINLAEFYPKIAYYNGSDFEVVPYVPIGDPVLSGTADYKVNIEVPIGMEVAHSGRVVLREEGNTLKITAELKDARDFAVTIGEFNVYESECNGIKVKHYTRNSEDSTSLIGRYLTEFEEGIGDFPYETITIVETPFEYGGMEYSSMAIVNEVAENKEEIIAHELLHQYFACAVGSNGYAESFLDESLVSFLTIYYMDIVKGGGVYQLELKKAQKYYETFLASARVVYGKAYNPIMAKPLDEYKSLYEYDALVYKQGVIAYNGIFELMGERKFNKAVKDYYQNNKGKVASAQDLYASFEKVGGKGMQSVFKAYLSGKTEYGANIIAV